MYAPLLFHKLPVKNHVITKMQHIENPVTSALTLPSQFTDTLLIVDKEDTETVLGALIKVKAGYKAHICKGVCLIYEETQDIKYVINNLKVILEANTGFLQFYTCGATAELFLCGNPQDTYLRDRV